MIFTYKAYNDQGQKVSGEVDYENRGDAINYLRSQNLRVLSIDVKKPSLSTQLKDAGLTLIGQRFRNRIKMRQIESLREELLLNGMDEATVTRDMSNFSIATFDMELAKSMYPNRFTEIQWDKIRSGRRASQSRREGKTTRKPVKLNIMNRITLDELIVFTEQLAILLSTGVRMAESLSTIEGSMTNKRFRSVIQQITFDMSVGNSFSEALKAHEDVFSTFYVSLVLVGEESGGKLPDVLRDIVKQLKMRQRMNREVRKAAVYPSILGGLMLVILAFLNYFLIPRFEGIFSNMEFELPVLTQIIFGISKNFGYFFFGFIFLVVLSIVIFTKFPYIRSKVKTWLDYAFLRIPVIKTFVLTSIMYQLSTTLALTLRNGIPIRDSLNLVNGVVGNSYVRRDLEGIYFGLEDGKELPDAFNEQQYVSSIVKLSVASGEKSGRLPETLESVSEYYEGELDAKVGSLVQFLIPMSIIIMAAVIGPFILGMYLPITSMTDQIQNVR